MDRTGHSPHSHTCNSPQCPCWQAGLEAKGGIVVGPEGALWIADSQHGKAYRITTTGVVTTFLLGDPVPGDLVMAAQAFLTLLDDPSTMYGADRVRARTRLEAEIAKARR